MTKHFWSRFWEKRSQNYMKYCMGGRWTGFIQLQITVPNRDEGEKIASILVENRWCACAQILGPIQSQFFWKENLESQNEYLILVKTRDLLFDRISKLITENHSYECPQIVALPIIHISKSYQNWLDKQIRTVRD